MSPRMSWRTLQLSGGSTMWANASAAAAAVDDDAGVVVVDTAGVAWVDG